MNRRWLLLLLLTMMMMMMMMMMVMMMAAAAAVARRLGGVRLQWSQAPLESTACTKRVRHRCVVCSVSRALCLMLHNVCLWYLSCNPGGGE